MMTQVDDDQPLCSALLPALNSHPPVHILLHFELYGNEGRQEGPLCSTSEKPECTYYQIPEEMVGNHHFATEESIDPSSSVAAPLARISLRKIKFLSHQCQERYWRFSIAHSPM